MAVRDDRGFTLIEVLTSLGVIGVVLSAVTAFFVRSLILIDAQGAKQAAVQIAADAMEELRQIANADVPAWLAAQQHTPLVTVNELVYTRTWASAVTVAGLLNVTVAVRWTGRECPADGCTYLASTQISTATREPVFSSAGGS